MPWRRDRPLTISDLPAGLSKRRHLDPFGVSRSELLGKREPIGYGHAQRHQDLVPLMSQPRVSLDATHPTFENL